MRRLEPLPAMRISCGMSRRLRSPGPATALALTSCRETPRRREAGRQARNGNDGDTAIQDDLELHGGGVEGRFNITRHSSDKFPSWSPDGSKIAFISNRDGSPQIYIMNADGTNQFKIWRDCFYKYSFTKFTDDLTILHYFSLEVPVNTAAGDLGYGYRQVRGN